MGVQGVQRVQGQQGWTFLACANEGEEALLGEAGYEALPWPGQDLAETDKTRGGAHGQKLSDTSCSELAR